MEHTTKVETLPSEIRSQETLFAEVIGLESGYILFNILHDDKGEDFRTQRFDDELFEEMNLNLNQIIRLDIITEKGSKRFIWDDNEKYIADEFEKFFKRTDLFA